MTETMLMAMARRMSRPSMVSAGTRITPPPMPLIAPTKPARMDTAKSSGIDTPSGTIAHTGNCVQLGYVTRVLQLCGGNKVLAAQRLGISRPTLARWIADGGAVNDSCSGEPR